MKHLKLYSKCEVFEKKFNLIEKKVKGRYHIFIDFGPMIFLDPGSLAFDHSEKYGYRLKFKSFNDYYQAMSSPHWMYWISYETLNAYTLDLANLILESSEKLLNYKKEWGMITENDLDRIFISEFDEIIKSKTLISVTIESENSQRFQKILFYLFLTFSSIVNKVMRLPSSLKKCRRFGGKLTQTFEPSGIATLLLTLIV